MAENDIRTGGKCVDVGRHDVAWGAFPVVMVQGPALEERYRLREIQVPPDDLVVENLLRSEDVRIGEMGLVVLGEQRATVGQCNRVLVDVHDLCIGLSPLHDAMSVFGGGHS